MEPATMSSFDETMNHEEQKILFPEKSSSSGDETIDENISNNANKHQVHNETYFPVGSQVYVPDADAGYVRATVTSCGKQEEEDGFVRGKLGRVILASNGAEIDVTPAMSARVERWYEPNPKLTDLSKLQDLTRPSLLDHVRLRYLNNEIYSNVGPILLSVNPLKTIPGLYSEERRGAYYLGETDLPHVYQVASRVFDGVTTGRDQSCIFSGESGAGKTEATKIFLAYVTYASERRSEGQGSHVIRERLLEANPLIEAFGNAKTARNDNSSRFGAWIQIHVAKNGAISGASLTNYLLEKTRVVKHGTLERSFHVMYQVAAAHATGILAGLLASRFDNDENLPQYRFLGPGITSLEKDANGWQITSKALCAFGLDPVKIARIVAGILELGQVDFSTTLHSSTREECAMLKDEQRAQVSKACALLGLDVDATEHALLERDMSNTKEAIFKPHNAEQARESRDALAKHVYARLFDWLVHCVNSGIAPSSTTNLKGMNDEETTTNVIGLLDTFGFESFACNGFEQLLINYCNERIMAHFNSVVIAAEHRVYVDEGLAESVRVDYESNQKIIELFESSTKIPGLFSLLDDEIRIPKGTDVTFLKKLRDRQASNPILVPHVPESRVGVRAKSTFGIRHFAGEVLYDVNQFLDKNRDFLSPQLERLCSESQNELLSTRVFSLLPSMSSSISPTKKSTTTQSASSLTEQQLVMGGAARAHQKVSVVTRFHAQLNDLTAKISGTQTHFIRCLKPNDMEIPNKFVGSLIMDQLRYGGVFEACRLRRNGYEIRRSHPEFVSQFARLIPGFPTNGNATDLAREIAKRFFGGDESRVVVGKSTVFLKTSELNHLENGLNDARLRGASTIQKVWRHRCARQLTKARVAFHAKLKRAMDRLDDGEIDRLLSEDATKLLVNEDVRRAAKQLSEWIKQEQCVAASLEYAAQGKDREVLRSTLVLADEVGHDVTNLLRPAQTHARNVLEALNLEAEEMQRQRDIVLCQQQKQQRRETKAANQIQRSFRAKMKAQRELKEKIVQEATQRLDASTLHAKFRLQFGPNSNDVASLASAIEDARVHGVDQVLIKEAENLLFEMDKAKVVEKRRKRSKWWAWLVCGACGVTEDVVYEPVNPPLSI